jgi:hypothetical protein
MVESRPPGMSQNHSLRIAEYRLPQGSRNQGYLAVKLVQKRFDMIGEKARCFLQCKATLMAQAV